MGVWGWRQSESWLRFLLALGIPLLAAVVWGVFAIPGDPSRSGSAPVPVPGVLRLALELAFFAFAAWALYDLGSSGLSWALGLTTAAHYLVSYDRVSWLIRQR
jgi:hypothetical protein